ncbi:MAG: NADAR family protein [Verrucomicrobia bacterium]|nr:NADAR family protein [Verrucomicrobiota bacterium]
MRTVAPRIYKADECAVFRKTTAKYGGLSNMAGGFPLRVNEKRIGTSEVLYQLCRYPHLKEVQEMLINEPSPMTAKMKSRPYRKDSRPDFEWIKVTIMRWCIRVKLAQNWENYESVLESTKDMPIVEFSKKDPFWGAQPQEDGSLVGGNVMGRLLMELRQQLRGDEREKLKGLVMPPNIDGFFFLGRPIGPVEPTAHQEGSGITRQEGQATHRLPVRVRYVDINNDIPLHSDIVSIGDLFDNIDQVLSSGCEIESIDVSIRKNTVSDKRIENKKKEIRAEQIELKQLSKSTLQLGCRR